VSAGRRVPSATYRLQIRPGFGFAEAAQQADYLASLGVSHAYLSPILQAAPGSTHGYDVVDHTRLSDEAGGREAFDRMTRDLQGVGVRAVADVVPNHMAVPTPAYLNAPLWSVLGAGRESPFAHWFDIDWAGGDDTVLMPVLGSPLADVLAGGELEVAVDGGPKRDETVVRYYDHELPVRAGTADLQLEELLSRQWWRLAYWRTATTDLNYRRFFDVTTLVAVRVEVPDVFEQTHALLADLVANGSLDGLRIDHPDGLADPRGYLRQLAAATEDAWVVVEKILEGEEVLPQDWPCAGTTGYDALWRIGGVFVDPAGEEPLTDFLALVSGTRNTLEETVTRAKQEVVTRVQVPEVARLVRVLQRICDSPAAPLHPRPDSLGRVVGALLVAMDRYRAYVTPGGPAPQDAVTALADACRRAAQELSEEDQVVLELVRSLALGEADPELTRDNATDLADFITRFQQTCGPVMAKAIEDTAFYRWHRLVSLNEVGGDPAHFAVSPDELMEFAQRTSEMWPEAMTTLSTHDTKRSEDVRARLAAISERPQEWQTWVRRAQELARSYRGEPLDGSTEYLLWQTLVGVWPIDEERLMSYAQKAVREAKQHTTWTDPDACYEAAVSAFVSGVLTDEELGEHIVRWVTDTAPLARAATLGQKLLQLALPGVADVYQGTELVDLSLVDPDNRRDVDFGERRARLHRLDAGERPRDLSDEKLLVTSRALRLRQERPEWFLGAVARCTRVTTTDEHALAVGRGDWSGVHVVAVVTRLAGSLAGWDGSAVDLPPGDWDDVLTGHRFAGGALPLATLLADLPVALLRRTDV
jgi:(1->4)-alpha-D-glucan 1-alpha-D-glucosylmutase